MIREADLIAEFRCLERHVLVAWIEEGVIAPHRDAAGYLFDRVDRARVALACDLHYRMGLEHESLPVILSLIDQLHDARRHLKALTQAVAEQPDHVRRKITVHIASVRKAGDDERGEP